MVITAPTANAMAAAAVISSFVAAFDLSMAPSPEKLSKRSCIGTSRHAATISAIRRGAAIKI
jgi:hypothetical protein